VVGVIDPGAANASAASQTRRVVVIGTEATINSHAYAKALEDRRRYLQAVRDPDGSEARGKAACQEVQRPDRIDRDRTVGGTGTG